MVPCTRTRASAPLTVLLSTIVWSSSYSPNYLSAVAAAAVAAAAAASAAVVAATVAVAAGAGAAVAAISLSLPPCLLPSHGSCFIDKIEQ